MSKLDPDQRKRMVNDALNQAYGQKQKTATDVLYEKAQATTERIRAFVKPVLQAGGGHDDAALRVMICRMYLEEFDRYTKEDLVLLVAGIHLEIMMDNIKASPWGKDTPDTLSGK